MPTQWACERDAACRASESGGYDNWQRSGIDYPTIAGVSWASAMNVKVRIKFDEPTELDWQAMRSLANSLTNKKDSVRVVTDANEDDWLIAEFAMPAQTQDKAVDVIDRALRFSDMARIDSTISFPKTDAERARAQRKNERRRALRRNRRIGGC